MANVGQTSPGLGPRVLEKNKITYNYFKAVQSHLNKVERKRKGINRAKPARKAQQ